MSLRKALALRMARRYVCGSTIDDAIRGASLANSRGISAKINFLGESITDDSVAEGNLHEYLRVQKAIASSHGKGCISVKLSQFGLELKEKRAEERLERLAREASSLKQMVWMDMENTRLLEKTTSIYLRVFCRHNNVGITVQSYLRRSEKDMHKLLAEGAHIRLVKGAYSEPSELAFRSRREIRENFEKLMGMLFERGVKFSIATHNHKLIDYARQHSGSKDRVEFEKLKGIGDQQALELVRSGYRVSEYVPYGRQWYSYFLRRMNNDPGYLWPILCRIVWHPPS